MNDYEPQFAPPKLEPRKPVPPDLFEKVLSILGGAVLPVYLLILDPIMFRPYPCMGLLAGYGAFVYFAVALGITALVVWLFIDVKTHDAAAFFAGALLMGRFFAIATGVIMLPLTLIGLTVILGVLGFFPFLIAYIYHRAGVRAHKVAQMTAPDDRRTTAWMLAGVLVVMGIPALIQLGANAAIRQSVDKLIEDSSRAGQATAIQELKTTNLYCLGLCSSNISAALLMTNIPSLDYDTSNGVLSFDTRYAVLDQATGESMFRNTCLLPTTGGGD